MCSACDIKETSKYHNSIRHRSCSALCATALGLMLKNFLCHETNTYYYYSNCLFGFSGFIQYIL